jgi:hypothetical protein
MFVRVRTTTRLERADTIRHSLVYLVVSFSEVGKHD